MAELKQLGLSLRTYNFLNRAKIDTVEQLAQVSDSDLLRLRGFGIWCLAEVRQKLPKSAEVTHGNTINYHGYDLVAVTQADTKYTVFFRRLAG